MKKSLLIFSFTVIGLFMFGLGMEAARTDFWTIQGHGSFRNVDVIGVDNTGKLYLSDANGVDQFTVDTNGLVTASSITVNGLFGIESSTAPNNTTTVGITPTAAGQLLYDSTLAEVCVATAAAANSWISVTSTGTDKCSS